MVELNKGVLKKLQEWKNSPLQFVRDCIQVTPTEQQIDLLMAYKDNKRISVRSGHGCFARNTIVHMYPYGYKFVQNIQVGDTVMGPDSEPRRVLELFRGIAPLYRVKYNTGNDYYDVNGEHTLVLYCTRNIGGYKDREIYKIKVNDYLKLSDGIKKNLVGVKTKIDYPKIAVAIPPYILGLWLGDGTSVRAMLSNIDEEVIETWKLFGQVNGMEMIQIKGTISYYLRCNDVTRKLGITNPFMNCLNIYNLKGNKHIPQEYMFNSRDVRLKLLAGLIDTDGGLSVVKGNNYTYYFDQKDDALAEDVLTLAQSLGFRACLVKSKRNKVITHVNTKDSTFTEITNRVYISHCNDVIPTKIKRKQIPYDQLFQEDTLYANFKIKEIDEGDYFGFSVDEDNLFVLGDFSIVHNCGKDACASWLALHFMVTRPYAKVVVTAPTAHQLTDIFWTETSRWLRKSTLSEEFVVQKDKIYQKDAKAEWWMRAVSVSAKSSREEQAETLAGLHGDHLFIIADEASGIPDPVFIPLEGALTQPDNKVLLIGNPTKGSGYFYDTQFHNEFKKAWARLHWDSSKSTNVEPGYAPYMAAKYGVNSNVYRIRVLGEPPLADDTALIPLYAAEQCIGNEFEVSEDEPLYLGCDIARYGDDDSIIMPRKGNMIYQWDKYNGLNTITLGGFIQQSYQENGAEGCAIDVIGVGAGVADWLQKHNMRNLYMVNVANSSNDLEKYDRLRDQLWCAVRDRCMLGLYSFPSIKLPTDTESLGQQLANELASVRYGFNAHGGIKVESKKELKARGIASPNIADALCLSEYFSNISTKVFKKARSSKDSAVRPWQTGQNRGSGRVRSQNWMAV